MAWRGTGRHGGWRGWWSTRSRQSTGGPRHGADSCDTAVQQGRHGDAERIALAALQRAERHRDDGDALAEAITRLAELYRTQGRYQEAERLYQRAIALCEVRHPRRLAAVLNGLGLVYRAQGLYPLAEPLCRRALDIAEREHGPEHPITAAALRNLLTTCLAQHRYGEAGPLFRRAVALRERALGPRHPALAGSLSTYAAFLRRTNAGEEADAWEARARAIRAGS